MKINDVLVEATGATVAFAFGRFNPAHQGHIAVWRTVEDAGKNWFVGTNPNTIGPNDPLTFQQKSAWMEEIYPPISGHIVPQTSVLTLAAYIFKKLRNNESASIAYVTDDTDWAWSGKLLNQYNGVEGGHGYYKFAEIIHVPSPRVSSATALRDAARADDRVAFYHASGTDPKLTVAGKTYFDTVKEACEKYPLPVKKAKKVKEDEQKTQAKTWDQMTPQEKISGVKGRTVWNEKTRKYYTVFDVPVKSVKEDEERGEVKQQGQLIPWPAGTTKVHVSDVYDWYKLGMVISDLDDANPNTFGQGAPQSIIAFGSEEEESKLLPLLKRLGLRVDDLDPEGTDEIGEAYHAGSLYEMLTKNTPRVGY